ncbi:N-acetylglucosamine-6-phosphate deacetylase [Alphaproteobacteria bacterium GH1-50]|uniref:N-acetylglucosamine-6-phosphate deacetylase n=1 Tax=Kangsaoukella pontilimi TaxID=2691042 RepID=A0A7C9M9Q4_9RHOB|nr:N-acetylglucosamine-6-phosphate deacetylase [Kangsaoukella pontilimi]MXQ07453.1 N-acetylglucosamine-6-phosphate deacetylase [Kangsaoukella pontilimi]
MTRGVTIYRNGRLFDGERFRDGHVLRVENGHVTEIRPDADVGRGDRTIDLGGDIVSPGFVDLQVNGGGGIMFNDAPTVETLERIARAHRRLGVAALLPTLITDTTETTRAAIAAATEAARIGIPGIVGLHLEGPHLSIARKGAHDPALIRRMDETDLARLIEAADALPVLKVTLAPESVTPEQVAALSDAGVLVSLGHSDADFDTCRRYIDAGATCVTHLFNAMSQLGNRAPGLVGAALTSGRAHAGLIADAVHVHPETIRAAWAAKRGPGEIFLVSDAMAVAGTDETGFTLNGRTIRRKDGILTLADGTLAGADLDLVTAVRVMVEKVGIAPEAALRAATTVPARLIGLTHPGIPAPGAALSGMIRISADLTHVSTLG